MADVDALLNAIESAEAESYGGESDGTLSSVRAAAIDAYYGRNTVPAPDGNSQVISRDLFDTVEWIVPSLTRIFAATDEVVKFEPIGPDDEPRARQESLYINNLVTQRNQWEQVFHDWAKDGLLSQGYCMAYWDATRQVEYEQYSAQSDDAFAMLVQEPGVEVIEHSAEPDEEAAQAQQQAMQQQMQQWQQMAMQAQQQGQPAPPPPQEPPPPMLHALKLRRTSAEGKVALKVLPPERCLVHQRTPDYTLKDCDFFECWEEVTISSLRAMGFDVPDDIDADERGSADTEEDRARDQYGEERMHTDGWEPSMRKVRARMCWIRHDYDGDGIAELQYCMVVGRTLLYREEANRIPVASIVATPVPHRHIGISIADVVLDIQETKTAILRQGIDNLFHANNPRLFINDGRINLDDALTSRPGGVIRAVPNTNPVFGQDIAPLAIPNIFPQAVQGLEYMDSVRENRTGTNRYFTGVDQNALNKTASGIAQLTSSAAQRVEQIARMMAPSVEYLFAVVHELVLKHGHKREVVRLRGEWVTVDPSGWRKRRDLKIAVGLGSGNKEAVMAQLMTIFQAQMATLSMGVCTPENIYNTLAELTKAAGFASEGLFWTKPGPPQPAPPPPEIIKEQMRQQFEAQQADAERRFETWKTQATEATKTEVAQLQAQTQQLVALIKAYIDEQKQAITQEVAGAREETGRVKLQMDMMSRQQQPVSVNVGADETKRHIDELVGGLAEQFRGQLAELSQRMDASRTVGIQRVRDPKTGALIGGRITHADGSSRDVQIQ